MKIEHADKHPAVAPLVADERRLGALHVAEHERAEQAWITLNNLPAAPGRRVDALAESYLGGNSDPEVADRAGFIEHHAHEFRKATERTHALNIATQAARQRTEEARLTAGRDLAGELGPAMAKQSQRIRDAVVALHEAAGESVELLEFVEQQGYRVPVGTIPVLALPGCGGASETHSLLALWLKQNSA